MPLVLFDVCICKHFVHFRELVLFLLCSYVTCVFNACLAFYIFTFITNHSEQGAALHCLFPAFCQTV